MGSGFQAGTSHSLGKPWSFFLNYLTGGFGGYIPRRKPCPSGGDNQVEVKLVGPLNQHLLNLIDLIRDNPRNRNRPSLTCNQAGQGWTGCIEPLIARSAV